MRFARAFATGAYRRSRHERSIGMLPTTSLYSKTLASTPTAWPASRDTATPTPLRASPSGVPSHACTAGKPPILPAKK